MSDEQTTTQVNGDAQVSGNAKNAGTQSGSAQTNGSQSGQNVGGQNVEQDLQEAQKMVAELTEVSKRALADLANYRKRVEQERSNFVKFANADLLLQLIPVLDNFHRAATHLPQDLKESEWVKGVLQIERQLSDIFQRQGLVEIPVEIGEPLNTQKHEAVLQGPGEKDAVLEVLEKGFLLGDRVLRPAKVKVGSGS